jgi:tetratricopeptide (TPR) repeat protein
MRLNRREFLKYAAAGFAIQYLSPYAFANEASKKLVIQGEEKYSKGDLEGALADFQQAIKEDPKDAEAYNNVAAVYRKKGDFAAALPFQEKSVQLEGDSTGYANLGYNYIKLGLKEKALMAYQKALEYNPNDKKSQAWIEVLRKN